MSLQRKKVKVRAKSGKVYQRSMLVKSDEGGTRRAGRLHSLNPWEQRHVDHVSTNSVLPADRARMYGSSGPGSDHSWLAAIVGHTRQMSVDFATTNLPEREVLSGEHARLRRRVGEVEVASALRGFRRAEASSALNYESHNAISADAVRGGLIARYGRDNIHEVYQDPRKWVR